MRIITENGEFVLPSGFGVAITEYNQLLVSPGDQSAPLTLPRVAENLVLLGYGHRPDRRYKPLTDMAVVVVIGTDSKQANLCVNDPMSDDGINCTLYFNAGNFYSKIDKTRLNKLSWDSYTTSGTLETKVAYLIEMLKSEYGAPDEDCPFRVAPLVTDTTVTRVIGGEEYEEQLTLNEFDVYNPDFDFILEMSTRNMNANFEKFLGESAQVFKDRGDNVNVTAGYGMTVFVKLKYILDKIASTFGYAMDISNIEAIMADFGNKACVVNTVADAIYAGTLKLSQLVPNVTVKEFISEIEINLAGKFIVNDISGKITFVFYRDAINAEPDMDLTSYKSSEAYLALPEFAELVITDTNSGIFKENEAWGATVEKSVDLCHAEFLNRVLHLNVFSAQTNSMSFVFCRGDKAIHLNSIVQYSDNEVKENDREPNKRVQLIYIDDEKFTESFLLLDENGDDPPIGEEHTAILHYVPSKELFYGESELPATTAIEKLRWLYKELSGFYADSNISIPCKTRMPAHVMAKLKKDVPKLLDGQVVLIEEIKYELPDGDEQEVKLRTMRKYF